MKPTTDRRPVRGHLAAVAAGLALLAAAGCGSGSSTSSASAPVTSAASSPSAASPAATSVLCTDAAALRTSLGKLTHLNVGAGTANEIKTNLTDVQASLTTFVNDAKGQWQAQTSALKAANAKLEVAVKSLTANPSVSAVASVTTALGDVNTAAQNLLAAVNTHCLAASPSASG
jgi:hypothetical protein